MNSKLIVESMIKKYNFKDYPEEYKQSLCEVLDISKEILKNNLLSITLGGSGGKNNIIEGWSDLDIYIVLNNYNIEEVRYLQEKLSKNKIHIGLTFYTLYEIENDLVDFKTKIMVYEKNNYPVNPTLYGYNYFKDVSYSEVYENDMLNYPVVLQAFKRMYIEVLNNERKIDKPYVKKMLLLMKCILSSHKIFAYGYNEVYQRYSIIVYQLENTTPFDKIFTDLENNTEIIKIISKDIIEYTEKGNLFKSDKSNTKTRKLKMVM